MPTDRRERPAGAPPRLLFGLGASAVFARRVADALGSALAPLEERDFEDGEHKVRPLVAVEGADCFVVQSLHGGAGQSANDRLIRLLFLAAALRDHGARRVTAVTPYLAYARKDRRTKHRDPLSLRYLAQLVEAVRIDAVVAMEVHNLAAFESAFRCRTVPLDLRAVFLDHAADLLGGARRVAVASPDPGGVKRAQLFREALEARLGRPVAAAYMEKRRSAGVVTGDFLIGAVDGAHVLVVDDLIASGGTLARAARALKEAGAVSVRALAAHGLFTAGAERLSSEPALDGVSVADTVALDPAMGHAGVAAVPAAPAFAEAIRRLHAAECLAGLTDPTP